MEQYLWIVWLCVFVLALIIESLTSNLVSIWFSTGALIPLILSFINGVSWWIQLIVFAVISFASFLFIRPALKKLIKKDSIDTNIDEIIGKKGIVTVGLTELDPGEVKINGVLWTAINTNENEPIEKDSKVIVVAIKGNKLIVKKI